MSSTACINPVPDSSVYVVSVNTTHAHYSCRGGYRYWHGDPYRLCDANGTWSGQTLLCTVDSVMPKTYLVILIVGATIAIFVACIPYDFYRFRKRKKKVRDHQERLSLVKRIAPSHATVVVDNETTTAKAAPAPPRKFGFKSLFSVFRLVGAKMKTAGEEDPKSAATASKCDASSLKNKPISEEGGSGGSSDGACGSGSGNESGSSNSCGGVYVGPVEKSCSSGEGCVDTDMQTASTLVFNPHHSNGCPVSGNDVIDLCSPSDMVSPDETSDDFEKQFCENNRDNVSHGNTSSCSLSDNKLMPNIVSKSPILHSTASSAHAISSPTTTSINSTAFRRAVQKSNSSLASRKSKRLAKSISDTKISAENLNLNFNLNLDNNSKSRSTENTAMISNSNPATVQVTPISSATTSPSSSASNSKLNGEISFYLPPPPPAGSSTVVDILWAPPIASSSSPNLCHLNRPEDRPRTFQSHCQTANGSGSESFMGSSNSSHHSMPIISDVPCIPHP